MNYTVLLAGVFAILCVAMWFLDARKSYQPPSFEDFVVQVAPAEDRAIYLEGEKGI